MAAARKEIKWGIIGYGGAFSTGKNHAAWINAGPGMRVIAACDIDPTRTEAAARDYPGIKTYTDHMEMLANKEIDCVVNSRTTCTIRSRWTRSRPRFRSHSLRRYGSTFQFQRTALWESWSRRNSLNSRTPDPRRLAGGE